MMLIFKVHKKKVLVASNQLPIFFIVIQAKFLCLSPSCFIIEILVINYNIVSQHKSTCVFITIF
jgi:hypothetical protein